MRHWNLLVVYPSEGCIIIRFILEDIFLYQVYYPWIKQYFSLEIIHMGWPTKCTAVNVQRRLVRIEIYVLIFLINKLEKTELTRNDGLK